MKLLFLGSRRHGLHVLKAILDAGHDVRAVLTEDCGMDDVSSEDFQKVAADHGIDFFKTDRIEQAPWPERLAAYGADLGVCCGWRRLIREGAMAATRLGFIGPHGADLPKYRGFAATHWAMLNGDTHCGFCIMHFKPSEADTGDIVSRFSIPLDDETTIADLFERALEPTTQHILAAIDAFAHGTAHPEPQDDSRAVLAFPRLPEDGEIDWTRPAGEVQRLVRTVTRPYPGAFTHFEGRRLTIWKARVMENPPQFAGLPGHVVQVRGETGVLCGEGILVPELASFEGGDDFHPKDVFTTHRLRLGMNSTKEIESLRERVEQLERLVAELSGRS